MFGAQPWAGACAVCGGGIRAPHSEVPPPPTSRLWRHWLDGLFGAFFFENAVCASAKVTTASPAGHPAILDLRGYQKEAAA